MIQCSIVNVPYSLDLQKLEREVKICQMLEHSNIGMCDCKYMCVQVCYMRNHLVSNLFSLISYLNILQGHMPIESFSFKSYLNTHQKAYACSFSLSYFSHDSSFTCCF